MTESDILAMIKSQGESGADARERLRAKILALYQAAVAVYPRGNLTCKTPPSIDEVVETVLYHYDADNRRAVAAKLGMDYETMITLLCGYILGQDYRNCLSIRDL